MQYLHTLMHQAHTKIVSCATREGKKDRIPNELSRIQSLSVAIYAAHPGIWNRILNLMDDKDYKIDTMTYDEFLRLVFLTETRNSSTSTVVAFTLSLFNKKPVQKPPGPEDPRNIKEPKPRKQRVSSSSIYRTRTAHI